MKTKNLYILTAALLSALTSCDDNKMEWGSRMVIMPLHQQRFLRP